MKKYITILLIVFVFVVLAGCQDSKIKSIELVDFPDSIPARETIDVKVKVEPENSKRNKEYIITPSEGIVAISEDYSEIYTLNEGVTTIRVALRYNEEIYKDYQLEVTAPLRTEKNPKIKYGIYGISSNMNEKTSQYGVLFPSDVNVKNIRWDVTGNVEYNVSEDTNQVNVKIIDCIKPSTITCSLYIDDYKVVLTRDIITDNKWEVINPEGFGLKGEDDIITFKQFEYDIIAPQGYDINKFEWSFIGDINVNDYDNGVILVDSMFVGDSYVKGVYEDEESNRDYKIVIERKIPTIERRPIEEFELKIEKTTINVLEEIEFSYDIKPSDSHSIEEIRIKSENEEVVRIYDNKIIGVRPGVATIKIKNIDCAPNKTYEFEIEVVGEATINYEYYQTIVISSDQENKYDKYNLNIIHETGIYGKLKDEDLNNDLIIKDFVKLEEQFNKYSSKDINDYFNKDIFENNYVIVHKRVNGTNDRYAYFGLFNQNNEYSIFADYVSYGTSTTMEGFVEFIIVPKAEFVNEPSEIVDIKIK